MCYAGSAFYGPATRPDLARRSRFLSPALLARPVVFVLRGPGDHRDPPPPTRPGGARCGYLTFDVGAVFLRVGVHRPMLPAGSARGYGKPWANGILSVLRKGQLGRPVAHTLDPATAQRPCRSAPGKVLEERKWRRCRTPGRDGGCATSYRPAAVRSCHAGDVVRTVRRSEPGVSGVRRRAGRARLHRADGLPRRAVLGHTRAQGLLRSARHVLSRRHVRQGRKRAVGPHPESSSA
jgi:hypothetical protein